MNMMMVVKVGSLISIQKANSFSSQYVLSIKMYNLKMYSNLHTNQPMVTNSPSYLQRCALNLHNFTKSSSVLPQSPSPELPPLTETVTTLISHY